MCLCLFFKLGNGLCPFYGHLNYISVYSCIPFNAFPAVCLLKLLILTANSWNYLILMVLNGHSQISCADNQILLLRMPSMEILRSIAGIKVCESHLFCQWMHLLSVSYTDWYLACSRLLLWILSIGIVGSCANVCFTIILFTWATAYVLKICTAYHAHVRSSGFSEEFIDSYGNQMFCSDSLIHTESFGICPVLLHCQQAECDCSWLLSGVYVTL